uniref:THAP-type domain-containing protein n=1 Tax=Lepeophtheirus salmonis TaxID=72036 RepID=A0A0K2U1T0_LEPSM
MPTKSCTPGCRTNYNNEPHRSGVTIHLWPNKERNPRLDTAWLRAIPRETDLKKTDEAPSKSTNQCFLHFNYSDFIYGSKRSNNLWQGSKEEVRQLLTSYAYACNCPSFTGTSNQM